MTVSSRKWNGPRQPAIRERMRLFCRGLVFAAGVTLRQSGMDLASSPREHPPFVQLLDDHPQRFSQGELVGPWVLTTEHRMPLEDGRLTGNRN